MHHFTLTTQWLGPNKQPIHLHSDQALSEKEGPYNKHLTQWLQPTHDVDHPTHKRQSRMLQQKVLRGVFIDPDNRGCYMYRAQAGDTLEDISNATGIRIEDLQESNAANIVDFRRMEGRFIKLCNIKSKLYCWITGHMLDTTGPRDGRSSLFFLHSSQRSKAYSPHS